jgi:hypothetical protein
MKLTEVSLRNTKVCVTLYRFYRSMHQRFSWRNLILPTNTKFNRNMYISFKDETRGQICSVIPYAQEQVAFLHSSTPNF